MGAALPATEGEPASGNRLSKLVLKVKKEPTGLRLSFKRADESGKGFRKVFLP